MKEWLRRIWDDVRKGENIDLYVTVFAALVLAVLNIVGITSAEWIAPITLAVLGLLAVATLGNRYRIEKVLQEIKSPSREVLFEEFPEDVKEHIALSSEVWIVGVTLTRTIKTYYEILRHKLHKGDKVKVLLVHPAGPPLEIVGRRAVFSITPERGESEIRTSLEDLCYLKKYGGDNLEIRTIEYPISYGAIVINPYSSDGLLYLEHYPYKTERSSMPKMILSARQSPKWFELYRQELTSLWDSGSEWMCEQQ